MKPGKWVPINRSSLARRLRASDEALNRAWIGSALMRADKGAQGLRDRKGEEEVGSWELFLQVVMEPLLGFMLLTLWDSAGFRTSD